MASRAVVRVIGRTVSHTPNCPIFTKMGQLGSQRMMCGPHPPTMLPLSMVAMLPDEVDPLP